MNRGSLALIVSSAFLLGPALKADSKAEDPKEILARASQSYQDLKSYEFEGKSVSESTIGGKTSRTEVAFIAAYQAPNKMRLEFKYPNAGNWVRVSDGEFALVTRTLTKESRRSPVDDRTLHALNSSPVYALQNLAESVDHAQLMPPESIEIGGHKLDCYVIRFAAHPLTLRPDESAGTSTVWVDKASGLVVRQEIVTTGSNHEPTPGKRIVTVDNFRINSEIANDLFSTKSQSHHSEGASNRK